MRMSICGGLPPLLVILCAAQGLCGDKADTYRDKRGQLQHKLELFRGYDGPNGREGEIWTIEPAGAWRVSQVIKGKEGEKPLRHGTLTPKQLAALANHLAVQDLIKLPKEFGSFLPIAHPKHITIRFGEHETAFGLVALPSDLTEIAPEPGHPQAAAWSRFIALVFVIENMTRQPKEPVKEKKSID